MEDPGIDVSMATYWERKHYWEGVLRDLWNRMGVYFDYEERYDYVLEPYGHVEIGIIQM